MEAVVVVVKTLKLVYPFHLCLRVRMSVVQQFLSDFLELFTFFLSVTFVGLHLLLSLVQPSLQRVAPVHSLHDTSQIVAHSKSSSYSNDGSNFSSSIYTIQPVVKPVVQSGLTTVLNEQSVRSTRLNEQRLFVQHCCQTGCTTGSIV